MSLASLNFLFRADTENFQRKLRQSRKDVGTFSKGIQSLAPMIAGAFSVAAITNFGKACVQAFDEAEKSSAKLLNAVDGNQDAFRRLSDQAALLQSNSLFDDESIKDAQTFLASMGLAENQIARLIPVIMDFATKFGMELPEAANLFAKTLGSSTNAMSRYGIQVEGAVGSTERFNSLTENASKQVEGFAKSATDAGVSGIVQLKNAFNDLQEVIGGVIGKQLNDLVQSFKLFLELKTGVIAKNYATQFEQEGRAMAASAKTTEEAREALTNYIIALQNTKPKIAESIEEEKKLSRQTILNGKVHREHELILKDLQARWEGNDTAIQALTDTLNNEKAIEELVAKGTIELTGAVELAKGLYAELNRKIEENEKLITAANNESTIIRLRNENAELQKQKELLDKLGETNYESPMAKLGNKPGKVSGVEVDQEAVRNAEIFGWKLDAVAEAEKKLAASSVDWEKVSGEFEQFINDETMAIELTNTLAASIALLGDQLAQGADSWAEYGELVVKSLKQAIAMIIKEGVAIAVKNALIEYGATGPVALALAALTGGLAAGIFSTALNQIPSFAEGGFVKSPQLIVAGDAKDGNGEWILNSKQMKNLTAQKQAPFMIKGELKARGRELVYVFNNESGFHGRT